MHKRERIRSEAVTAATGLTTTGANAFNELIFPLAQTELPAWVVSAGDEEIETVAIEDGGDGNLQERQLELVFTGVARATSGELLQDTFDDMLEELEAAVLITAFTDLFSLDLSSVEFELDVDEVDSAQGSMVVTYVAGYETTKGAAGT